MTKNSKTLLFALLALFSVFAPSRASGLDELKATIQSMQKSMEQMQARIAELEQREPSVTA